MWRQFRTAIIFLVVFTVITGVIYPLIVTGVAQAFFHRQANGSLIVSNGQVAGSALIGSSSATPLISGEGYRQRHLIRIMPHLHPVQITVPKTRPCKMKCRRESMH